MTNIELQRILSQLPPNMEVAAFGLGNKTVRKITAAYTGNEKYISSRNINKPDKVFIQYE